MTGGITTTEVREKKTKAVKIFEDAMFKWYSNLETVESDERNLKENAINNYQSTFAKQQIRPRHAETKLLGLPWNKKEVTLSIDTRKQRPSNNEKESRFTARQCVLSSRVDFSNSTTWKSPLS